jgi:hypothetical protein
MRSTSSSIITGTITTIPTTITIGGEGRCG